MFPKAHATAYVMMALRIAWFKVYHPIYYYAVYFSKRAKAFDCETFVEGRNAIRNMINSIEKKDDKKNKEIDLLDELKIALEATKMAHKIILEIYQNEDFQTEIKRKKYKHYGKKSCYKNKEVLGKKTVCKEKRKIYIPVR